MSKGRNHPYIKGQIYPLKLTNMEVTDNIDRLKTRSLADITDIQNTHRLSERLGLLSTTSVFFFNIISRLDHI